MIAALSFLLDYEKIEDDDDDSDASSAEDDPNPRSAQVVISKESIYKVRDTLYFVFFWNSRGSHSTMTNKSHYHNSPHA